MQSLIHFVANFRDDFACGRRYYSSCKQAPSHDLHI